MNHSSRMHALVLFLITCGYPLVTHAATPSDTPAPRHVKMIEVLDHPDGPAVMRKFDPACHTFDYGKITGIKRIQLGDILSVGTGIDKLDMPVGLIELRPGDVDKNGIVLEYYCLLAEKALPRSGNGCREVWVYVPACRSLE